MLLKKAIAVKNDAMGKTSFFLPLPLRRVAPIGHQNLRIIVCPD